jgi:hypothetical protein
LLNSGVVVELLLPLLGVVLGNHRAQPAQDTLRSAQCQNAGPTRGRQDHGYRALRSSPLRSLSDVPSPSARALAALSRLTFAGQVFQRLKPLGTPPNGAAISKNAVTGSWRTKTLQRRGTSGHRRCLG